MVKLEESCSLPHALLVCRSPGVQSHMLPGISSNCREGVAQTGGGEVGKVAQSMACVSVTICVTLEEQPVCAPHTRLQQGLESTGREVTDVSDWGGGGQSIYHVALPACSKETASESWAGNQLPRPIRPLSHSEAAAVTLHGAGVGPVHKLIPGGEAGPLTQSTEDKSLLPSSILESFDSALNASTSSPGGSHCSGH